MNYASGTVEVEDEPIDACHVTVTPDNKLALKILGVVVNDSLRGREEEANERVDCFRGGGGSAD